VLPIAGATPIAATVRPNRMRTVVIFLLLANLSFFAYTRLDVAPEGEAARIAEQVQPDKIKLLTPQQVAALGPGKVAALADVCLEWGPLGDADRVRALADLEPLALGKLLTQRRVETTMAFWVYVPPLANRAAAERRAADVRARGIGDVTVVDSGPQRFALALGVFRTEEAAQQRVKDLVAHGVANAKADPRQQVMTQTMLVIRDPQAPAVARVRELVVAYPGSEAKVGSCEKG
jgi:hypothetical protein